MRKVLVVVDAFFPIVDGVTRFIKEVLPGLNKRVSVAIAAPRYRRSGVYHHMPLVTFPMLRMLKIAAGRMYFTPIPLPFRMARLVRSSDVVFAQSLPFLGMMAILCAKIYRKPVIFYLHILGWEQISYMMKGPRMLKRAVRSCVLFLARQLCNQCDIVMVPSQNMKALLVGEGFTSRMEIVQLGVNTRLFKPSNNMKRAKRKLGISARSFVIGYCGRFSAEKDVASLVAAVRELNMQHDNLVLLLVGFGTIDPSWKNLKNLRITNFVENVVPYYHAMDVLVQPSLTETTGLALVEAMSCGVPVITTPVGFAQTNIINGENGLVFSQKDVSALSNQIELLIRNKELRAKLAKNGRYTVATTFSWDKTIDEIAKIIDAVGSIELVSRPEPKPPDTQVSKERNAPSQQTANTADNSLTGN